MLNKGDKVPDFTLPLATAEGKEEFRLSDALGDGPVVFEFFPFAFSGGCTEHACGVRDDLSDITQLNATVYGFDADHFFTNTAFIQQNNLGFPIISDANSEVLPDVWEVHELAGVENRARRGVMVLDSEGVVQYVWKTDDPSVMPPLEEVREVVASAAPTA